MTPPEILQMIGHFSEMDVELFDKYTTRKKLPKGTFLMNEREICTSFYFILEGSFVQFQKQENTEQIIDLHLAHEWMFNQESLTEQVPSKTSIRAFSNAEIICLSLYQFHALCEHSQAFLQFGKLLNQTKLRAAIYDRALNPTDKYHFIHLTKPQWLQAFPLKMIASYLKVTPETLSRIRANY